MEAPVNVLLENPTIQIDGWEDQKRGWLALNQDVSGNPYFYPLTIKGAYMIGLIHQLCTSVDVLLSEKSFINQTYIPAYGVFASGVELLGRCLRGNATTGNTGKDLEKGFDWMLSPDTSLVTPRTQTAYTIDNLVGLRHYAAHGQATSNPRNGGSYQFGQIDIDLLELMPDLMGKALDRYWAELKKNEGLCNNLAFANVIAFRPSPVFESWSLFEKDERGDYYSIHDIFTRFDWRI